MHTPAIQTKADTMSCTEPAAASHSHGKGLRLLLPKTYRTINRHLHKTSLIGNFEPIQAHGEYKRRYPHERSTCCDRKARPVSLQSFYLAGLCKGFRATRVSCHPGRGKKSARSVRFPGASLFILCNTWRGHTARRHHAISESRYTDCGLSSR